MTPHRLKYLLDQVQQRVATPAECDELIALIRADENDEYTSIITDYHLEYLSVNVTEGKAADIDWHAAAKEVLQVTKNIPEQTPVHSILYMRRWWVAASVLLLFCAGGYLLFLTRESNNPDIVETVIQPDIKAGKSGAILTLADGRQVVLDSMGNGLVAQQNGAKAIMRNGKLVYDAQQSGTTEIVYNTMSTPKGRQFHVTLPDGTRVWLNASSSVRYPTVFSGKDREVDITGEVYFEIEKDASKPFFVRVNNATAVEVLGTSFNVNAYTNEETVNTTLIDGKVKVLSSSKAEVLLPGKQAQVQQNNIRIVNADVDRVLAWKNGFFDFEGISVAEILRQLERWYDIEVVYPNSIPNVVLTGQVTRDVSLQGLLRGLDALGLRTKLEGRKLIILP